MAQRFKSKCIALAGCSLLLLLALLVSCTTDAAKETRSLDFALSDSLKQYSKVVVTILDAKDSSKVLDTAFSGRLLDPKNMAKYRLPDSIGADFQIRVQGFDSLGLLALQSDIKVNGGVPSTAQKTPPEMLPAFQPISTLTRLKSLVLSSGVLVPPFTPGVFVYSVTVPFALDMVTLNAVVVDTQATLDLNGIPMESGVTMGSGKLKVGANPLRVNVHSKGAVAPIVYSINVNRNSGAEARLDSILISEGQLTPLFNPDSASYTVLVGANADSFVVRPFPKERQAQITVNGHKPDSLKGELVLLKTGVANTITIKVTSLDSSSIKTYVLNVKFAASADAACSNINVKTSLVSEVYLYPAFSPDIEKYTATVASSSIIIIASSRTAGATVTHKGGSINGVITSVQLDTGTTVLNVLATAPDKKTTRTYVISLTQSSAAANLKSMTLNGAQLNSVFSATKYQYGATLDSGKSQITVSCQPLSPVKFITATVNGSSNGVITNVTSVPGTTILTIPISVGMNSIGIEVTALNGLSKNLYSVDILRKFGAIAELDSLYLEGGRLTPAFSPKILDYQDSVDAVTSSINLNARAKDSLGWVIVRHLHPVGGVTGAANDTVSKDTLRYPKISLKTKQLLSGPNFLEIQVIAEDKLTTKKYLVSVIRRPSNFTALTGLTLASKTAPLVLSPTFFSLTQSYSTSTLADSITVTATPLETAGTVSVNGSATVAGAPSKLIGLVKGINTVSVVSTSPSGTNKFTYTVAVTRL